MKVKIVQWQGSHRPVYEEIGEISAWMEKIGYNSEKEELCIDIDNLMDWVNRKK